jgi:hypothetical protein
VHGPLAHAVNQSGLLIASVPVWRYGTIEGLDQGNRSAINPGASALVERTGVSITTPALRAALRLYAGQQLGRSALAARLGSGRDVDDRVASGFPCCAIR